MIKLIISDLCGVVFYCEEPPFIKYFARRHNLSEEIVDEIFSSQMKRAEKGEIPLKQAIGNFLENFNNEASAEETLLKLISFKRLNNDTLGLLKRLKKGYKLAYLTNSSVELMMLSEERMPIKQYFDFGIISAQINARKPDPKGFTLILEHFKAEPEETVFIDDAAKNLTNAEEMGIKTILFEDATQLENELKKCGVKA